MNAGKTFLDHAQERYNSNDVAWAWIKRKEAELEAWLQEQDDPSAWLYVVHLLKNKFNAEQILDFLKISRDGLLEYDREVKARNNVD